MFMMFSINPSMNIKMNIKCEHHDVHIRSYTIFFIFLDDLNTRNAILNNRYYVSIITMYILEVILNIVMFILYIFITMYILGFILNIMMFILYIFITMYILGFILNIMMFILYIFITMYILGFILNIMNIKMLVNFSFLY
jgi:hypothetical protein